MAAIPSLVGKTISNRELMDIFKCACEGGIRYSKKTDTIVLVKNNVKNRYPMEWKGSQIDFIGRSTNDHSKLSGFNKRLAEFLHSGGDVRLFEVNVPGEYTYMGKVKVAGDPFTKEISTENGNRMFWVFPLEIVSA